MSKTSVYVHILNEINQNFCLCVGLMTIINLKLFFMYCWQQLMQKTFCRRPVYVFSYFVHLTRKQDFRLVCVLGISWSYYELMITSCFGNILINTQIFEYFKLVWGPDLFDVDSSVKLTFWILQVLVVKLQIKEKLMDFLCSNCYSSYFGENYCVFSWNFDILS